MSYQKAIYDREHPRYGMPKIDYTAFAETKFAMAFSIDL